MSLTEARMSQRRPSCKWLLTCSRIGRSLTSGKLYPLRKSRFSLFGQIGDLKKINSITPATDKPKKNKSGGGKGKEESEAKKKLTDERYTTKYVWKLVPTATVELTAKEVETKTYHFCHYHNKGLGTWVIPVPSKWDLHDKVKKDKPMTDKQDHVFDQGAPGDSGGEPVSDDAFK